MILIKKRNHTLKFVLWGLLIATVVVGFFNFPLPKLVEGPGEAVNLQSMVNVKNHPDRYKGQLLLTSVGISQATPYTYLQSYFTPYLDIENIDQVTDGQSNQTYEQVQNFYMQSAINSAIYVSYRAAHQKVALKNNGIYVLSKLKQSAFPNLKVGDIILRVDNKKYANAQAYQHAIQKKKVGDKLTIRYLRNHHSSETTGKLIQLPGTQKAGIGITLTDNLQVKTKLSSSIDPGEIGGPSAGLMFALQLYSQLTNQNLKHGKIIAGTGTISPSGQVGEIGGIDKKVITARDQGAKYFLAPYVKPTKSILALEPGHKTNYQLAKATAKKYAPEMKVIPVQSFDEALRALKKIN